jgi:hypothetical protein
LALITISIIRHTLSNTALFDSHLITHISLDLHKFGKHFLRPPTLRNLCS